jgi:hypothetical protein
MKFRYLVCCLLVAACGCTNVQLRKDSVGEAGAVGDIFTQEVLNNLAMFVCDPNSLPFFSYPCQSSASVADVGGASATPSLTWLSSTFGLSLQRTATDGYTVQPVTDPRKLELMRCAYQQAIQSCVPDAVATTCPDCQTRFKVFYTGDPNGDIRANANGMVTSECLKSNGCWFHAGCERCVPKHCRCLMIGRYHGVYVWVGPEGRDQLTKLTLAILDYAQNNPPVQLTKTVAYNIDAYGLPTSSASSVGTVSATIGISENPASLLNTPQTDEARVERNLDRRLRSIRETLAASKDPSERAALLGQQQIIQDKLDFLHEQLRAGQLKSQYSLPAATPTPFAGGILGLQQQLQTLAPTAPAIPTH